MEKQFVTYEIASKLKELGFDEKCLADYFVFGDGIAVDGYYGKTEPELFIDDIHSVEDREEELGMFAYHLLSVPLWQQVVDWLRENHDIDIEIHASFGSGGRWWANLCYNPTRSEVLNIARFENYYEAREQAILKAIELCQES